MRDLDWPFGANAVGARRDLQDSIRLGWTALKAACRFQTIFSHGLRSSRAQSTCYAALLVRRRNWSVDGLSCLWEKV